MNNKNQYLLSFQNVTGLSLNSAYYCINKTPK